MLMKSKIIISSLVILCLILGGGWAYSEGYVKGLPVFQSEEELEAKESSFWASYINRFTFNEIDFVQNIAVAIPIPEKLQYDKNYLVGALTLKHEDTKSRIFYVDTPLRVDIKNELGIFYYTKVILESNVTRHKFLAQPNTEYNIEYQINNINEFIDFSGEVSFKLRDSEETISYDVVTEFLAPLSDYPEKELTVGSYNFVNEPGEYLNGTFVGEYEITLNERNSGWLFNVPFSFGLYDDGSNIVVYHWKNYADNKIVQTNIATTTSNLKIIVNETSIKVGSTVYNNLWDLSPKNKIFYFGGASVTTRVDSINFPQITSVYYYDRTEFCKIIGFTGVGSYGRGDYDYLYYIEGSPLQYRYDRSYALSYVDCHVSYNNLKSIKLQDGLMDYPYLIDSSRTFTINEIIPEVKIDYGEIIKTIDSSVEGNKTTIVIPDDIELAEFEPKKLALIIGDETKYLKYYNDPLKQNVELWEMFERKFEEAE